MVEIALGGLGLDTIIPERPTVGGADVESMEMLCLICEFLAPLGLVLEDFVDEWSEQKDEAFRVFRFRPVEGLWTEHAEDLSQFADLQEG
jgi:hypothetical protein